jgi:hypothetical protein
MLLTNKIEKKLTDKIVVNEETGCWEWQGARNKAGYGVIKIDRKFWLVHRLSYSLFKIDIPSGAGINLPIMHSCDNPCCFNPDHLRMGTTKENNLDCTAKGRNRNFRNNGSRGNGKPPKLTKVETNEIKEFAETERYTVNELSILYNVCKGTIYKVINNKYVI